MDQASFLARFRPVEAPRQPPDGPAWIGGADPEAFAARLEEAGGVVRRATPDDWVHQVAEQAGEWGVHLAVATAEGRLQPAVEALRSEGLEVRVAGTRDLRERAAAAQMGLTGARWALASTGTVVLVSSAEAPRLVSLLPRAHLAVVWEEELLPDLAELARRVRGLGPIPSGVTLVTGPSRTADIEQTVVVGVHGPERMGVVLISPPSAVPGSTVR
ncbi:MAG: LutC/YkgG family protein [Acidimicrobiia bacterium]